MLDKLKKIVFNWVNLLGFFLAALCAFVHVPQYFEAYFPPLTPSPDVWWGLDTSWMLALNYTNINQAVWGVDFAYTYGPLSYLSTRIAWGTDGTALFLFDIFFFMNLFLMCFLSFKKSSNKLITAALIIAYILLLPGHVGPGTPLILMCFLVFWIRQSIDKPKYVYYLFQIILLYLLFFIKFNTGLIAFPLFYVGLIYNLICKKEKLYLLLIYAVAPVAIILLSCGYLNVDFVPYVKTAMEIVSGYNDIMYLGHDISIRKIALFIGFATVLILIHKLIVERKTKTDLWKNLAILALYGIPVFVLYKQSFVRGVEPYFFIFSILLILAVQDLHFTNYKRYSALIVLAVIFFSCKMVYFTPEIQGRTTFETTSKLDKYYLIGMKNFTATSGLHIIPNSNQLPASVKEKIGSNSVDIYPWNAQLLLENELKFKARPVFQSYAAYTPYLEELNFNHYNEPSKAPEFVLYEYLAIDQRYPLFDEPKVNLCLLKNYTPVEMFDFQTRKFLLLQKRKDFRPIKLEKTKEYAMMMDSPLVPQEGIYYEVGVYHSLKGRIASIIDHGPPINLEVISKGPIPFRTGKKLLETGLFSDKNITKTEDFYALYNSDSIKKLETIKGYQFRPQNNSMYKDKIRITEYKIIQ